MKKWLNGVALSVLTAGSALAASEMVEHPPEETVSMTVVALFGVIFLVACIWIGVAVMQAEKRAQAERDAKDV